MLITVCGQEYDENITILNLSNKNLTKIPENLDKFKNLKTLYLNNNQIRKIENLNNLIKLESLYLNDNKIYEIENLDSLINLNLLNLEKNSISKIKGLEKLDKLKLFYIGNNQISKRNLTQFLGKNKHITCFCDYQDINLNNEFVDMLNQKFNEYVKNNKYSLVIVECNNTSTYINGHTNDYNIVYEFKYQNYVIKGVSCIDRIKESFNSIIEVNEKIINIIKLFQEKLTQEIKCENSNLYVIDDMGDRYYIAGIYYMDYMLLNYTDFDVNDEYLQKYFKSCYKLPIKPFEQLVIDDLKEKYKNENIKYVNNVLSINDIVINIKHDTHFSDIVKIIEQNSQLIYEL